MVWSPTSELGLIYGCRRSALGTETLQCGAWWGWRPSVREVLASVVQSVVAENGTKRSLVEEGAVRFASLSRHSSLLPSHSSRHAKRNLRKTTCTSSTHPLILQRYRPHPQPPHAMAPSETPPSPKAVLITYDGVVERHMERPGPFFSSVRLHCSRVPGFKGHCYWKPLPLTAKLGIPLRFASLYGEEFPLEENESLDILSLDCDPDSDRFGESVHFSGTVVVVAREDRTDLLPKQMRTIFEFLVLELQPLIEYGREVEDSATVEEEYGKGKGKGKMAQIHIRSVEAESDSENINDKPGQVVDPAMSNGRATKQRAEVAVARITPENFAAYFNSVKQAADDPTWKVVKCPLQDVLVCERCEVDDGAGERALLRCGACKCVYYCSADCQREDWRDHKAACKVIVEKQNTEWQPRNFYE